MARKPTTTDAPMEDLPINGVGPDLDWYPPTVAEARAMPLSQALANARAEFKQIRRTKEGQIQNRKYMYADHADVLDAVVETLAKYEVEVAHTILFKPMETYTSRGDLVRENWMFIEVSLIKNEDRRALEWPIGPIGSDNQRNGANLTYAKRYAISTILNLAPDDDTDGVSPDANDDRGRRSDSHRGRDDDRRSNFDRENEDPDAWRDSVQGNGNGRSRSRDDGGRNNGQDRGREERETRSSVRSEPVRRGPDEVDASYRVAIDSLNSAGNRRSCEMFWDTFKKNTKLSEDSREYEEVKELYKKRWSHHKKLDEAAKDPLGAADDKKPETDIHPSEDHVSPDAAMDQVQKLLENCTSIVEYDRILKEHAGLFDAAGQFPPDRELIDDMKDETITRLREDEAGEKSRSEHEQRMEDVEDGDRNENSGPDIGNERF